MIFSCLTNQSHILLPYITVILAMSTDGKIADVDRSPARFGSAQDKQHLEAQIAQADAVLFGAGTLRAYGTTLRIMHSEWLQTRTHQGKPAQPIHIVCSRSGQFDRQIPFFRQPVPRWLLTTETGGSQWQQGQEFEQVLIYPEQAGAIDWIATLARLKAEGIDRLAVTGGGELVAGLVAADLVDDLWLTICPILLGGATAPTPVEGAGFSATIAPRLELLSSEVKGQEVFLHYRRLRSTPAKPEP